MAGHLKKLKDAGLLEALDKILAEYCEKPGLVEELKKAIDDDDEKGLQGPQVMMIIAKYNRIGGLKGGIYRQFVELNMSLAGKMPPTEGEGKETKTDSPPTEEGNKEKKMTTKKKAAPKKAASKPKTAAKPKAKTATKAKPKTAAKPKAQKPAAKPASKPKAKPKKAASKKATGKKTVKVHKGDPTPIEEIIRPSSMAGKILALLVKKSLTTEELVLAGQKEGGFHEKRISSTLSVFDREGEKWYLPQYGWQLVKTEKKGDPAYQVVPASKK